ncbi:MAG: dihydropteroate synthase [Candidatus Zixiibacteriota bacterium]|nr:MAG: dihydropteroate synthase [candidate division Zixibacteria bacterium]
MLPKIVLKNKTLDFSQRAYIMGVLNLTPDSFFDGRRFLEPEAAVQHAFRMEAEGADIIALGGESPRPGAQAVPLKEEFRRVLPVLKRLSGRLKVPISIDTYKSEVAERCIQCGAEMVNDISGLYFDPRMKEIVARHQVPVIVMHIKGTPRDMQKDPQYRDLIGEILSYFRESISRADAAGVPADKIIIDPGIGFGKSFAHNLDILKGLESFKVLGKPIMVGVSRKSFLGKILDLPVDERLEGSIAAALYAVLRGANIVRVHDVAATVRALRTVEAIQRAA